MRILVCLGSLAVPVLLPCQDRVPNSGAAAGRLAAPVQVLAGDSPLGHDRLYPSPVWHDVDGDGALDLVVGDLHGPVGWIIVAAGDDYPAGGPPAIKRSRPPWSSRSDDAATFGCGLGRDVRLTFARRLPGGGVPNFAAEQPLLDARGEQVDFGNW